MHVLRPRSSRADELLDLLVDLPKSSSTWALIRCYILGLIAGLSPLSLAFFEAQQVMGREVKQKPTAGQKGKRRKSAKGSAATDMAPPRGKKAKTPRASAPGPPEKPTEQEVQETIAAVNRTILAEITALLCDESNAATVHF